MNVNGKVLAEVQTPEGLAVDGLELINSVLNSGTDLASLVEQDRRERVQKALTEIEEVLKKHNCRLEMAITIKGDGKILPDLAVFPN